MQTQAQSERKGYDFSSALSSVSMDSYKTARSLLISYHDNTGGVPSGLTEDSYQKLLATFDRFIECRETEIAMRKEAMQ